MGLAKWAVLGAVALAGCNDPGLRPQGGVVSVSAAEVATCRFVTNLAVEPSLYGPFSGAATRYSRNQILDEAARAGANRIVFDPVEPGAVVLQLKAQAYSC